MQLNRQTAPPLHRTGFNEKQASHPPEKWRPYRSQKTKNLPALGRWTLEEGFQSHHKTIDISRMNGHARSSRAKFVQNNLQCVNPCKKAGRSAFFSLLNSAFFTKYPKEVSRLKEREGQKCTQKVC
ncbi:hypothetical protein [Geobacillus sp. JS12]|uniref:hypothetical protein n=1 Tax=Geobacillus sp. JS12 TaxID=1813182 RepID=UPI001F161CEE|nr:hypothetical protein [Geobacillus sp. JS12]